MKKLYAVLIGVMLVFALAFTGCDMDVIIAEAAAPVFINEPADQPVIIPLGRESVRVTLTIDAESTDGGTLTYQWKSYTNQRQYNEDNGTAIQNGGTGASLNRTLNQGTFRYYVVVTNTNNKAKVKSVSKQSRGVTITVNAEGTAAIPEITGQPQDINCYTGDSRTLTVTANSPDNGVLSYRWYSSTTSSTEDFTPIEGSAGAGDSYTLDTSSPEVKYYYVQVTNTNSSQTTPTATLESNVVTVTVTEKPEADPTPNNTVTVSLTKRQYVRGFGGMDTPWNNTVGLNIDEYEKMFDPDKLGYNMMRIMVTAHNADYETTLTQLVAGTLVHSNEGVLSRPNQVEGVKIVNKYGGYVLASPWSPPAVWKTNNSWNGGGKLRTADYQNYANYLKSVGTVYANRNAPIYAISIQNEPNFTATYEGCEWSDAEMSTFFQTVGHFTTGQPGFGGGKATPYVLTMNGESANNPSINTTALNNATARAAIDLLGRHQYGNVTNTINTQGKEIWMTEMNKNSGSASGYPNDSKWDYVWKFMNYVDVAIRINSENAYIWWTAKRFYSMIGDGGNSQGINGYGTREGDILPRGYGLAHYARFAKETGRVDVSVSGSNASSVNGSTFGEDNTNVKISAFVTLNDDFYEAGVIDRKTRWDAMALDVSKIKAISLVMFTPGSTGGSGGTNMQTVKIQLPSGFIIGRAEAIKTNSSNATSQTISTALADEPVIIGRDGDCVFVTLPARTILSVRLNK